MAAEETFRIEIPIHVEDNTDPGVTRATQKMNAFDKANQKTQERLNQMNRAKYQVVLDALDKASGVVGSVSAKARSIAGKTYSFTVKALDMATAPLKAIWNFATSIQGAILGASGAYAAIYQPMNFAGDYEQTQIAFETMLKSAEKANKFLKEASNFANTTPFEFPELINSSKLLLAFGFDAKNVLSILKTVGDTASGLGAGADGIDRITRALGQMKAKGTAQAEELLQLEELGVPASQILQKELGLTAQQVANIGNEGIESGKVIDALLKGMNERFGGMMDKQSMTAKGMISTLSDTLKNGLLRPWGQGLWDGIKPGLEKITSWINNNQNTVSSWGDAWRKAGANISTWVMSKVDALKDSISRMINSQEWKDAQTFGQKLKVAWDKIIAEPFNEWWNGPGKKWMTDKALEIGNGIGSALKNGLLTLLGLAPEGAVSDGYSIGSSFAEGFIKGFEGKKVADALLKALKGIGKDAGTLVPGGAKPSSTSWISAAILSYFGFKGIKGIAGLAKGGSKAWGDISKGINWIGKVFKGSKVGSAAEGVTRVAEEVAPTVSKIPIYGAKGEILTSVEKQVDEVAKVAEVAGKSSKYTELISKLGPLTKSIKAVPLLGTTLGLLGSGVTIATAPKKERNQTIAGEAGSWIGMLAGAKLGASGGAAVGSIVPGIGTGIGAAVGGVTGGIVGAIGGEKFAKWLYDQKDNVAKLASDVGKSFNYTWEDIKKGASNTSSWISTKFDEAKTGLQGTWNNVSGWLEDTVGTPIKDAFINVANFIVGAGDMAYQGISNALTPVGSWIDTNVWQPIQNGATIAGDWIGQQFINAQTWAQSQWSTFSGWMDTNIWQPVQAGASNAGTWIGQQLNNTQMWIQNTWAGFSSWFDANISQPVENGATAAGNWISTQYSNAKSWVQNTWSTVSSWFGTNVWQPIQNGAAAAGNWIGTQLSNAKLWAQNTWASFSGWFNEHIYNPISNFANNAESRGSRITGLRPSAHAYGGIITKPHIGLVAEDGPEGIIPLSPSKRSRGLDLWQKAGQLLGVQAYTNGGIVGNTVSSIPLQPVDTWKDEPSPMAQDDYTVPVREPRLAMAGSGAIVNLNFNMAGLVKSIVVNNSKEIDKSLDDVAQIIVTKVKSILENLS